MTIKEKQVSEVQKTAVSCVNLDGKLITTPAGFIQHIFVDSSIVDNYLSNVDDEKVVSHRLGAYMDFNGNLLIIGKLYVYQGMTLEAHHWNYHPARKEMVLTHKTDHKGILRVTLEDGMTILPEAVDSMFKDTLTSLHGLYKLDPSKPTVQFAGFYIKVSA